MQKIKIHKIKELKVLKEKFAIKISNEIQQFVPSGTMIEKKVSDILNSKNDFIIFADKKNEILGFYEIRYYKFNNEIFWEMGSVISKQRNFFSEFLFPDFLKRKKIAKINHSFIITKSKKLAEKFAKISNGKITDFPKEFPRERFDRFFILF